MPFEKLDINKIIDEEKKKNKDFEIEYNKIKEEYEKRSQQIHKSTYIFPALFFYEKEGRYSVYFPDLDIATFGDNFEDAVYMAKDCLAGALLTKIEYNEDIPESTAIEDIKLTEDNIDTFGTDKFTAVLIDVNLP
ncbi:type II toxin-antitoxin system HicB family antitoxin [Alkaliphilus transvaalensis]|uniref:type II toxin-antitoxin system HicB family antitoxin n=1 Tax=Alkaliphilus transvaalensis TaxID=114628 RepID=UPI000684AABD|nr:type II toxin-antitoxin system HicB family antitoxin [Alkaliphilus transvaalensis]